MIVLWSIQLCWRFMGLLCQKLHFKSKAEWNEGLSTSQPAQVDNKPINYCCEELAPPSLHSTPLHTTHTQTHTQFTPSHRRAVRTSAVLCCKYLTTGKPNCIRNVWSDGEIVGEQLCVVSFKRRVEKIDNLRSKNSLAFAPPTVWLYIYSRLEAEIMTRKIKSMNMYSTYMNMYNNRYI